MPPISALHLGEEKFNSRRLTLPAPKSCLQLPFGSRKKCGSVVAVIAAAAAPSVRPISKWRPEIAIKKNTTLRHTPVFVGQEIDLICNNNFA